eukprot:109887_1
MVTRWFNIKTMKGFARINFIAICSICAIFIFIYHKTDEIKHNSKSLPLFSKSANRRTLQHKPIWIANVTQDMQKIIDHRNQMPRKCTSHSSDVLHFDPVSHNWAPYYYRCNYLVNRSLDKRQWCAEAFVTPDIFYNHVFKAGGTTIQGGLIHLTADKKLTNLNKLHSEYVVPGGEIANNPEFSLKNMFEFLNEDALRFTFLRDPIDKFLSAFYEAHYRISKDEFDVNTLPLRERENPDLSTIQILRIWIAFIMQQPLEFRNFINDHARPNTYFLQTGNWSLTMPLNFIGQLNHLSEDLPKLLLPYINDVELKANETLLMETYFRRRNKKLQNEYESLRKYEVNRSQLNSFDIMKICELYWLDYLCFPFELPKQCDLEQLILNHYGVDIEYYQCYI